MADRAQSRARPSSNGLALQSSGTGGSAPAACPMMRGLVVVTRTNISLRQRFLELVGRCEYISNNYRKVASSNTSCLEAHAGFFRLLMKGIFDPYALLPFDTKLIF